MPEVCRNKSLTVIGDLAGRSLSPSKTFVSANSGRYFDTGASRSSFPSSTSVNAAADVMAFDIE